MAAFASVQQRMHLFDLEDKQRLSYPEDALQNPHSGIADVELCDLDGNGTPEIYVGFWGVVGVHCVGLDGKRLWGNRSLANVARMAAGPADESGRRDLICMNILTEQNTSLVVLNAQGQGQGEFTVGKRSLRNFLAPILWATAICCGARWASRTRANPWPWASICRAMNCGTIDLPSEPQTRPIEPIIAGRLAPNGPGQWILPQPDGSIQILAADGKPIDRFNSGVVLQGMATAVLDGKPILLIASPGGLEAFAVE